jgi:hypothetical protein
LAVIVICAILGGMTGCGGGKGTLKGKVTFQGKPVVVGTVTVFASDGSVCLGPIQSDGSYEVKNVAQGTAKVAVSSPDTTQLNPLQLAQGKGSAGGKPPKAGDEDAPRPNPPGWMELPRKYADVATSDLTAKVSGGTNTQDISLK